MNLQAVLGSLLVLVAASGNAAAAPWVAAQGAVDVDGDAVPDAIRIETAHPTLVDDEEPCAGCGSRVEGVFSAVVTLSRSKRSVASPIALHTPGEVLWFWRGRAPVLVIADYNGDGRPDFNLGRFVNSVKWEYGLFGNAGETPGWWTFTCHWLRAEQKFACDGRADAAPR